MGATRGREPRSAARVRPPGTAWPLPAIGCALALAALAVSLAGAAWTAAPSEALHSSAGLADRLCIGAALIAGALGTCWVQLLRKRAIGFSDRVLPLSLGLGSLLAGALTLGTAHGGGSALAAGFGVALVIASAALALAYARRSPSDHAAPEPGYSYELLAKPLSYLFVYETIVAASFGGAAAIVAFHAETGPNPAWSALGGAMAAAAIVAVRLMRSDARAIDLITRLALIVELASWMLLLQPSLLPLALCCGGVGMGLFGYLIVRMALDLLQAFGIKRWFIPLSLAAAGFAACVAFAFAALFHASNPASDPLVGIVTACVVATCSVTVYGMGSERVWTAHDLRPPQSQGQDDQAMGSWSRACDRIASSCGLTRREREVFSLLSRGRNAAYVEQALVISNHTVRSHMMNIYRKLDIHSQQELIDRVEKERER